ncbi:hypothetical protein LTR62_001998 [Meristemomyces frigidus]|uniref:Bicarbonate transporter-like transmembrane domain-containing protein n=1 Tax=Meristemomyces frigidus TaxID=1508187 RepID=A0AAN7YHQ9_9PEZI|nr:hypothetical protein LTR62_001998 [Meristemomyces frigidus]
MVSQDEPDFSNDPYSWNGLTGWKSYRTLRPFRGMYWDVRRRLPYYWSDWRDGLNYRTLAGCVRIFFINLLPALAFELDMMRNTDGYFGINEALLSSALAAFVFSLFSCQPLTVVGITGLISLFNYTIFAITAEQGIRDLYPQFLAWCSIWAAITHWIAAACNWCDYMRYITDFSSNSFGFYVGIIYMVKGFQEIASTYYAVDDGNPRAAYLGVVIALCYFFSVWALESIGGTILFTPNIRKLLSDFAYPIATIFWTGFSHIPGHIKQADLPRVPHTRAFYPSVPRPGGVWLVDFWNLPVKWIFVTLPIGILITLLFYYDHNISSITAQAKQFPLKKPAGFHWDFFLLGITCFVGGVVGIPLPNGLVPQAPVHTDSVTEYVEVHARSREQWLDDGGERDESSGEGVQWIQHNNKKVEATKVNEQRVSHFLMCLAFVGLMAGPLLDVLHTMPRALFAGVFWIVGFTGLSAMNITQNWIYIFTEKRFVDPSDLRTGMKKWRIAYYTMFQFLGVAISVGLSFTRAAIGFPVVMIALIPLRWVILPRIFTEHELLILDAPTAEAEVVLASIGGRPTLPEVRLAEERRRQRGESGETAGSTHSGSEEAKAEGMRSREGFRDEEEREVEREKAEESKRRGVKADLITGHD